MAMPAFETELEALPELGELEGESFLEGELEGELEGAYEGELETEQFFGRLARLATSPALRRIGSMAAQAALQSLSESELAGEFELEGEGEGEYEFEYELNPIRRVYPDAMMEHLAHAAAEAETEQEAAEQFFPLIGLAAAKLLPLAAKALPSVMKIGAKVLPKVMNNAPKLMRGVSNITRTLFRNRRTRPLIRTMPTIVNNTVRSLARQAASGQPITSQRAVRTLAQQTNQMLSNPRRCAAAYRRSRGLDQQAHRIAGVSASASASGAPCPTCGRRKPQRCASCGR